MYRGGRLCLFAGSLWSFADGWWSFDGSLWSFAGGLWLLVVAVCFSNYHYTVLHQVRESGRGGG